MLVDCVIVRLCECLRACLRAAMCVRLTASLHVLCCLRDGLDARRGGELRLCYGCGGSGRSVAHAHTLLQPNNVHDTIPVSLPFANSYIIDDTVTVPGACGLVF